MPAPGGEPHTGHKPPCCVLPKAFPPKSVAICTQYTWRAAAIKGSSPGEISARSPANILSAFFSNRVSSACIKPVTVSFAVCVRDGFPFICMSIISSPCTHVGSLCKVLQSNSGMPVSRHSACLLASGSDGAEARSNAFCWTSDNNARKEK